MDIFSYVILRKWLISDETGHKIRLLHFHNFNLHKIILYANDKVGTRHFKHD